MTVYVDYNAVLPVTRTRLEAICGEHMFFGSVYNREYVHKTVAEKAPYLSACVVSDDVGKHEQLYVDGLNIIGESSMRTQFGDDFYGDIGDIHPYAIGTYSDIVHCLI